MEREDAVRYVKMEPAALRQKTAREFHLSLGAREIRAIDRRNRLHIEKYNKNEVTSTATAQRFSIARLTCR